ncbi:twin-arginine translocase TatA/TatE family subunit [Phaeocystidibacter luteus]|uniref:Sec-independent protein translocase protein TatA n=1 Tax=Phaeocystidibacter luteus TaxID=911197 RepID=A0A6N6RKS6_9FLAO|nr:twin-arginine translocase TatA/TatE family subunit [Phaeocystidibacter luteus]KAB2808713.1 twin-arginine translocase TatA/TatE family subunit [Phaeocystidibacter luteus]NVK28997.1 twin-arginine translocase TatA/TatE family subunit [Flavobacteriia bacterium]
MNETFLFIQKFGIWGFVLILVVVLILFGGRKIPELMRGLGGGIKEFKDAVKEDEKSDAKSDNKEK